jgi:peptidoglycan/xylan/chitin deacetylase (PgdA/CDA1 family)
VYFYKTPKLLEYIYPEAIWHGDRSKKNIYLTFDDGPVPRVTEYILDLLSDLTVKASFFCVGENVKNHPKIFDRMIQDGHGIGNHTFNHLNGWTTSDREYVENIQMCSDILQHSGHQGHPLYFRPPYGRIRKNILKKINAAYKIIMWDVLSHDFSSKVSPETCFQKSLQHTKNGSIIVFHDSIKTFEKIKFVISQFILYLRDKNYEFHVIDDIFLPNR